MRFMVGDIVKFSKQGRDEGRYDYGNGTKSEGTIIDTSFLDRIGGFCIQIEWDDDYDGNLCSENELRLVRRTT